jgi:hypothetical protein
MAKGIYQSCDVYFYHFAQRIGMDPIAAMAHRLGLGQEFELPVVGQSYGTVPDPAWKKRKYGKDWAVFDTVNATIGQGYFLVNPLQQAVMTSRIASGRNLMPRLLHTDKPTKAPSLGISEEHLAYIHKAMSDVVNGPGTAGRAALPMKDILNELDARRGDARRLHRGAGNGRRAPGGNADGHHAAIPAADPVHRAGAADLFFSYDAAACGLERGYLYRRVLLNRRDPCISKFHAHPAPALTPFVSFDSRPYATVSRNVQMYLNETQKLSHPGVLLAYRLLGRPTFRRVVKGIFGALKLRSELGERAGLAPRHYNRKALPCPIHGNVWRNFSGRPCAGVTVA